MEFVYVVPREELFPHCYPQGFLAFGETEDVDLSLEAFLSTIHARGFFVERAYAERTPALQQIIPYSVIRMAPETGSTTPNDPILLLRRTNRGGEARLHDKLSIGVGGHLNPEDLREGEQDVITAGTRRELLEELHIDGRWDVCPVGILNDDSNPVGAVHVGLAQIVTVHGRVDIREKEQLEGQSVAPVDLRGLLSDGANFETWSQLLISDLDRLLGRQTEPAAASPPGNSAKTRPVSANT